MMNKQESQVGLKQIIADKTTLPTDIVDAYVDQLFEEMRKGIVDDSFLKLEGFGLFRVIKSGESQRILFLGSKQPVEESLNILDFNDEVNKLLPEKKVDVTQKDTNPVFEKIEQPLCFDTTEELVIEDVEISDDTTSDNQILYYPKTKNKSKFLKIFVAIAIVVISLIVLLYSRSKNDTEGVAYSINFVELENLDPSNFSYIIIPESDVSLEYISNTYYGCIDYWPYIYIANEDFVDSHLVIQAGSIIKIPKVMIDVIDYQNGNALMSAKKMGEKIKREKKIN